MVFGKNVTQEELALLLKKSVAELNNTSMEWLSKSVNTNDFFQKEIFLFLKQERKCIAYLLWKAYNNKLVTSASQKAS